MQVIVAKMAGFCKGVKHALEVTLDAIKNRAEGETICTYGPLIHNRQVLAMLEENGIFEESRIERCAGNKVVIRAHGIPPNERQALHRVGATILNATCTRVAKVHGIIKRHARHGYHTVIVGDNDHAEVIGLMGYTDGRGVVINQPDQVDELPADWDKTLLVAQTTQNEEVFGTIEERFKARYPEGVVKNTICGSTHERQAEVRQMCSRVEAMVIVGGRHSGNTVRLAEIARECAVPTYHIETEADLNRQEMARYACVGVSAGASTPNWIIQNVVQFLESINPERSSFRFKAKRALELLAYGNIYVALGAALLTFAVQALSGLPLSLAGSGMAACYVFAMHSLNIYMDRAVQLNDPDRAAFYQRWRAAFTWVGTIAVAAALLLALTIGVATLVAMSILIVLGLLYAVPLFQPSWHNRLSALKLKDIPTSKTFFVPIAWASVIVLLPLLPYFSEYFARILYGFWIIFLMVLIRTVLLDLLAIQGDRIVGKETLVVLAGEASTARFTAGMLMLLACSLLIGPLLGLSSSFAYVVLLVVVVYGWFLRACFQDRLKEDPFFETLIESVAMSTGLAAILWNALTAPFGSS